MFEIVHSVNLGKHVSDLTTLLEDARLNPTELALMMIEEEHSITSGFAHPCQLEIVRVTGWHEPNKICEECERRSMILVTLRQLAALTLLPDYIHPMQVFALGSMKIVQLHRNKLYRVPGIILYKSLSAVIQAEENSSRTQNEHISPDERFSQCRSRTIDADFLTIHNTNGLHFACSRSTSV